MRSITPSTSLFSNRPERKAGGRIPNLPKSFVLPIRRDSRDAERVKNSVRMFLVWVAAALVCGAQEKQSSSQISNYIRYLDKGTGDARVERLQTGLTRFTHAEKSISVDLVAVIHVGDLAYYEGINNLLRNYQTVYFEMVGGDSRELDKPGEEAQRKKPQFAQTPMQQVVQFLGLQQQRKVINYHAPNFVRADLDWKEFYELMEMRNQSLASIFEQMGKRRKTNMNQLSLMKSAYLGSLTGGDRLQMKRDLARHISDAEALIAALEGQGGTVLVAERNKAVTQKLSEAISGNAAAGTRFAILYGAAHMPDFESRLLNMGFDKTASKWLDAWSISGSRETENQNTPLNRYLQSLSSGDPAKIKEAKRLYQKSLGEANAAPGENP